jgi:hypothetical protein
MHAECGAIEPLLGEDVARGRVGVAANDQRSARMAFGKQAA